MSESVAAPTLRLGAARVPSRTASGRPSLRVERTLHRQGVRLVAGMDEVGRGALAGPVTVGVVVVGESTPSAPAGVRDSKLLRASVREELAPRLRRWALAHGVGHASPAEIDRLGIMAALRLAGLRALSAAAVRPDVVLLDGGHDWLTDPSRKGLLALVAEANGEPCAPPVRTLIKADLRCSSVAAASVLAKVERDAHMRRLAEQSASYARYGWQDNKGYAAAGHAAALREHGPCEHHRRSWNLLGGDLAAPAADTGGIDER